MSYGDVRDRLAGLPHPPGDGTAYALTDLFTVRHRLIREMDPAPRSVFEFGALLGFFLVTAIDAAPSIRHAGWVDNETHTPGSNRLCYDNIASLGAGVSAMAWTELGHFRSYVAEADAGLIVPSWSRADLVQVDSDHSYEGCLRDLEAAERLQPRWLVIDDWTAETHADDIQAATRAWLTSQPPERWRLTEHETQNGLAVLTRSDAA